MWTRRSKHFAQQQDAEVLKRKLSAHLSIIYQSSISTSFAILLTSEIFDFSSRAFVRASAQRQRLWPHALWLLPALLSGPAPWTPCRTPGWWRVKWWSIIFHVTYHTSLGATSQRKHMETLQSSWTQWMNLQFIILGPLWTSNQQAALFYSGLGQSISMISSFI